MDWVITIIDAKGLRQVTVQADSMEEAISKGEEVLYA